MGARNRRIASQLWIALCLFACFRAKKDPFDLSVIRDDLRARTAQDVIDAAAKTDFMPPVHGRVSEQQIVDFIRWETLNRRTAVVLTMHFKEQRDAMASDGSRAAKAGLIVAESGSERLRNTIGMRSALALGLNPGEQLWVKKRVGTAEALLLEGETIDEKLAKRKSDAGEAGGRDPNGYFEGLYKDTLSEREAWQARVSPAEEANMVLVKKHLAEIRRLYAGN